MNNNYFEEVKTQVAKNKIFMIIIGAMFIINIIAIKGLVSVSANKTVNLSVPTFLEGGEYVIGSSFANDKTYKMWTKLWISELANFSYKDVRERVGHIIEFLAPETAYKNKADLLDFISFIEKNFITQSFRAEDFKIKKLDGGYVEIKWKGNLTRKVGLKESELSNLDYTYTFVCFVRNGQIYIHSLKSQLSTPGEKIVRDRLKQNDFIDYNETYDLSNPRDAKDKKAKDDQAKADKENNKESAK